MAFRLIRTLRLVTLLSMAVCGNASAEAVVATPLTKLDDHCYCSKNQPTNGTSPDYIVVSAYVGTQKQIHCCASEILPPGHEDYENVSVSWNYNGTPYRWSVVDSQFGDRGCFPQQVEATSVVTSDEGNYTCEYHLPGRRIISRTTFLKVHDKGTTDPVIVSMPGVVVARQGESVSISCRAYTGSGMFHFGLGSVQWWAYDEDGWEVPAGNVTGVTVENRPGSGQGMYTSTMSIAHVTSPHFGVYTCTASNENNSIMSNVTLKFGVDVVVAKMERYKTLTILLTVGGLVFCFLVTFMYRNKLRIALLLRQYSHEAVGDFKSDVFIIHGESCVDWVMTELLPQLETVHGYKCYLPFRDLEGGDALVDALPRELQRSRRVLLVVTHCLLDSPWSLWCIEQALHSVLTHRLKMAAVLLQDIRDLERTPQATRLLSRISVTKKIRHPSFISTKCKKDTNRIKDPKNDSKSIYPDLRINSIAVDKLEDEKHDLVLTDTIMSDFESHRRATQNAQFRHEGFFVGCRISHPKSDNCLDKMGHETTENFCSKAKSDLYLNLTVPDYNLCAKSNSLQNQRLANMISSTLNLEVDSSLKEHDGHHECVPTTWEQAHRDENLKRNPHFFGEDVNQNTDDQDFSFNIKRNHHFFNEGVNICQKQSGQTPVCQVKFANFPNGRDTADDKGLKGSQYMECVRPYKVKNVQHQLEDQIEPDSPCSVTPFILPSREKEKDLARIRQRKQTVMGSMTLCVTAFFTRHPEEHFWQRLLLQLPAEPLTRQRQRQALA